MRTYSEQPVGLLIVEEHFKNWLVLTSFFCISEKYPAEAFPKEQDIVDVADIRVICGKTLDISFANSKRLDSESFPPQTHRNPKPTVQVLKS